MRREELIEVFQGWMINFIKVSFKWLTTDGEVLGHILAVLHFMISGMFYLLIIISHTIYPSTVLQVIVFVCVLIIWLQHIVLQVCISTVAEQTLTNIFAPSVKFFNAVLSIFGLRFSFQEYGSYFMVGETVCLGMLGLELISKLSIYLYMKNGTIY